MELVRGEHLSNLRLGIKTRHYKILDFLELNE